jgi:hypothetical protein
MGSGLLMDWKEDAAYVAFLMPHAAETLGEDANVKEGDRLVTLQGNAIEDVDVLAEQWEAIEAGAEVVMVFARSDEEFSITFSKGEAPKGGSRFITQ